MKVVEWLLRVMVLLILLLRWSCWLRIHVSICRCPARPTSIVYQLIESHLVLEIAMMVNVIHLAGQWKELSPKRKVKTRDQELN